MAQTKSPPPATITRVRVLLDQTPPALEVISSRPIIPTISKLDGPPRLVIDLPDAIMSVQSKRIDVHNDAITAVRLNQFQKAPPVVRIVMDLVRPADYHSEATGNLLLLRLRPAGVVVTRRPAEAPTVSALTPGKPPVMVPVSSGSGAVMLAGSRLASGSSVTAGSDTTVLQLGRGGEVRVCPGTTLSVTSSRNGRDLMLGMSTGSLEAHYRLEASADSVLTPDFRILMAGPGEFHYAFSADARGNTCVRALPGNTASVIVSELMGDGTYQVKPTDQIVFHSGRLNAVDTAVPGNCGCPVPPVSVMRAATPLVPPPSGDSSPASFRLAPLGGSAMPVAPPVQALGLPSSAPPPAQVTLSVTSPEATVPPSQPNEVHVKVDAPLVFRASDPPLPPAPIEEAQRLSFHLSAPSAPLPAAVLPPPSQAQPKAERRGFFGKVRGFFAAIFH